MAKADEEVTLQEVEDAGRAMRAVRKNADARWVAGLTPHDDDAIPLPPADEDNNVPLRRMTREAAWLRRECQLLFVAGLGTLRTSKSYLDFPLDEMRSWDVLKETSTVEILAVFALHLLTAYALGRLALKIGGASQYFSSFMAFGVAAIVGLAALGDVVLLLGACRWKANECFLPFVLHWITACLEWFAPCASLALTSYVIGSIEVVRNKANWPRWIALAVALAPLFAVVASGYFGWAGDIQQAHDICVYGQIAAGVALMFFSWRLSHVHRFWAFVDEKQKPHKD